MEYERYMVFKWSEYDNVSPFECLDRSFSDIGEAKQYTLENGECDDDGYELYCIFDRIDGVMIDAKSQ